MVPKITDEQKAFITATYASRFGVKVKSVTAGADDIFGGSFAIARYEPVGDEVVSDAVYIDSEGKPQIFDTTQELILFLQQKTRFLWVDLVFGSKLFTGIIFILLLVGVFIGGWRGKDAFDDRALGILGSVVGLAAGLFFGAGKK